VRLAPGVLEAWGVILAATCCFGPLAAAERSDNAIAPAAHVATAGNGNEAFEQAKLVRELMRRRGGDPAAAAQLIQLTREFAPADAAEAFEQLAAAHQAAGNLDLAAETRRMLVESYPDEPLARAARLWLVRLYASSEVALAHRPSGGPADEVEQSMALYALQLGSGLAPASAATGSGDEPATPSLAKADDHALTFARAVAARRSGNAKAAGGLLTPLKHTRPGDPWGDCARVEAWLAESRSAAPPKPVARCVAAGERPHLDGVLEEPYWQAGAGLMLGDAASPGGAVMLAYDRKHLYVAATCIKRPGVDYADNGSPRTYDADLTGRDRVRIVLDADRDYATGFELVVDSRGWTGDRAWDDASWNPEWFVAAGEGNAASGATWSVEAAIPWSALAARPPQAGHAWACAVERLAPPDVLERWACDAAATAPQCFGMLLFE
jgi:hypothetical protein